MRTHFKHSVELVDGEGEIADVLAAVEDLLLAQATYEAARQRWPLANALKPRTVEYPPPVGYRPSCFVLRNEGTLVTPSEMRAKASNASNVHGQRATPA